MKLPKMMGKKVYICEKLGIGNFKVGHPIERGKNDSTQFGPDEGWHALS